MPAASQSPVRERWLSVLQLLTVALVITGTSSVAKALTPNQAGFVSAFESGLCLAPSSSSQGASVQQVTCTGASSQKFWMEPMGDGSYRIRHNDTGMCVDISGGSTANGGSAILWGCGGQANQRWTADETVAHHIRFIVRHSGKCLDVPGQSTSSGTNLTQYDCNGQYNQEFMLLNDGYFASAHGPVATMQAVHSNKCVDVMGISLEVGHPLYQWDCWEGQNQRFEYIEVANNQYVVRALHSRLCIGPEGGSGADGAPIRQYGCTGAASQRFQNRRTSDDIFEVVNIGSGKCLDITGGPAYTGNGVPLQQYGCGGGTNQRFRVHRDVGDRNFCSASDPAACRTDVIAGGAYGSYTNCEYGYNTGAGWHNSEFVYYDATDRCAWWHDKECWSRNNKTGVYEGMGGCSQDVNFIACVENTLPITAEEAANRDCVDNSMLEDAADMCEPFTWGRGAWYPLYNGERAGGSCDDVAYAPGR